MLMTMMVVVVVVIVYMYLYHQLGIAPLFLTTDLIIFLFSKRTRSIRNTEHDLLQGVNKCGYKEECSCVVYACASERLWLHRFLTTSR